MIKNDFTKAVLIGLATLLGGGGYLYYQLSGSDGLTNNAQELTDSASEMQRLSGDLLKEFQKLEYNIRNLEQTIATISPRCLDSKGAHWSCPSVAEYLKSRISEEPLSVEETENLPSFTGEEYPAPPFIFQI